MRDAWERFEALGADVLAVSAERPEAGEAYLRRTPLPFPVLVDADHAVFDAYDVTSRMISLGQRPGLFVVDRDGVVRLDHVGRQQWEIPPVDAVLDAVAALGRPG